jgi:hypothetical protein
MTVTSGVVKRPRNPTSAPDRLAGAAGALIRSEDRTAGGRHGDGTGGQRRIPLDELARLPSFMLPRLSWGRDKVALYYDRTGRVELYVLDLATRELRQVSRGEVPRAPKAGFTWERSDRALVFGKDRDGDEQNDLYRIELESGAVTQLTSDPTCQEYPGNTARTTPG